MKAVLPVLILFALAGAILADTLSGQPERLVRIGFYHDANLNGRQDPGEPELTSLKVSAAGAFRPAARGGILVPAGRTVLLDVRGHSPAGKPLTVAIRQTGETILMLPRFSYGPGRRDSTIGLADGFLTAPVKPHEMHDQSGALRNPAEWHNRCKPLYPAGWPYLPTYFYYGYRIPAGGLAGTPHLAFDIGAEPGKPVLAAAPGTVVQGLYDWRFGISGPFGTIYYNHIVPVVRIGATVRRYDVVGHIAPGQGNHVHFELRPDPARILEAFPGVKGSFFLKSPLRGERVPLPPFFARH